MHGIPAMCTRSLPISLFKKAISPFRGIQVINMLRKVISLLLCQRFTTWRYPIRAGALPIRVLPVLEHFSFVEQCHVVSLRCCWRSIEVRCCG